jgi:uncharacterized protein YlxP (DUF503 family)
MPVAALTVELRIEHAQSLKDRRQVVRSVKEKLAHGFNISIAELDEAVTWQSATIGVVAISSSRDYLTGLMRQVEDAATRIANDLGATISDCWWQFLDEGSTLETMEQGQGQG